MRKLAQGLVLGLLLLWAVPVFACWGFRPMGMGGTFVAVADDANCAYWNRAGAAMLNNFSDGESQLVYTGSVYNSGGFFSRTGRLGNAYYDSFNFAQRLDKDSGWTLSGAWSGGGAFDLSPGFAMRIPDMNIDWLKNQSFGLGIFIWSQEFYVQNQGQLIRVNGFVQQLHVDWLWRVTREFSAGVHIERFLQYGTYTSPDLPSLSESANTGPDKMNFRPSIAWWVRPNWIINAGIYDLFNCGGGPHFSIGTEYVLDKWALRCGLYNFGGSISGSGAYTFGFGYQLNKDIELGYWLGIFEGATALDKWSHNVGISWKFGGREDSPIKIKNTGKKKTWNDVIKVKK